MQEVHKKLRRMNQTPLIARVVTNYRNRVTEDEVSNAQIEFLLKGKDEDFAEALARIMTSLEFDLLTTIKPHEFLGQAFEKPNSSVNAPHICTSSEWGNDVSATRAFLIRRFSSEVSMVRNYCLTNRRYPTSRKIF